ncbi:DUF4116 domain-containing protein [Phocaeicola vulgatus]|uniref:DUF4116 domain-containing protein n=1 Tax=Bacteroidales TaxID=171549 RepID=UPI0039B430BA
MTEQERIDIAYLDTGVYENPWRENLFETLPEDRKTAEVCRFAIKKSAFNIEFVPEAMKTPELCLAAAGHRGETLKFVPDRLKTPKMCRAAVDSNSYALYYVPEGLKTPELCMAAVKRNGLVLEAVPGELRTPQICRAALKAVDSADYKILPYIPYPDICLEGLKKFGMSFVDKFEIFASIAPEVMTGELALHGVGMDASCLSLVPVELRTEAVCLRAVSGDGILLHEVPEELRTERVCEAAVSSNYLALEYVPKHLKTDRLCGMALERDPLAIRFFNPEQLTPEVCNRALARTDDLRVLRYIPFEEIHLKVLGFYCTNYDKTFDFLENMNPWFLTPRVAREIFALEPELFYNLPDHAKNEEMCRRAVGHDGSYLQYVPEKWKTPELCMEAIRRSPYAIAHLPESMKSPDLYMSLVRENPQNLKGVPREARTPEMSREAFERTYGKDKTDFSVISALSDSALVLQVFREQDDPQQIHRLMSVLHLNRRLVTEEVALEAVRKDAGVLYDIPQRAITSLVADTAVRGDPRMIQWVPRELRTADLCLYAEAAHPELRVYVPDEIAKGRNIYSFHRQVDAKLRQPLEYEQYKTLYSGGAVRVNNVWTSVAGEIDCCEVRYDRKTEKIKLRIVEPPREKKAQPKVAPRKPARGPKL